MAQEITVDRALRFEAASHLRNTPNVRDTLLWIREHPEEWTVRVSEFDVAITSLNDYMFPTTTGHFVDKQKEETASLRNALTEMKLPTLSELVASQNPETTDSLFTEIDQLIRTKNWEFVTEITDNPNRLASGVLIEGYGVLLEQILKSPGVGRHFVIAFESALHRFHKESQLYQDIVPWMREEYMDFPAEVAAQLVEDDPELSAHLWVSWLETSIAGIQTLPDIDTDRAIRGIIVGDLIGDARNGFIAAHTFAEIAEGKRCLTPEHQNHIAYGTLLSWREFTISIAQFGHLLPKQTRQAFTEFFETHEVSIQRIIRGNTMTPKEILDELERINAELRTLHDNQPGMSSDDTKYALYALYPNDFPDWKNI